LLSLVIGVRYVPKADLGAKTKLTNGPTPAR